MARAVAGNTRTDLAGLTAVNGQGAILWEDGRESLFTFDASDLSTMVAADTAQGIFIAPTSDATGASGAWIRRFSGAKDARWFGATGDGVTDDYAALQAWLDSGGGLFLPALKFRSSQRLLIRKFVVIQGEIYGFASQLYASVPAIPGARIVFDAGVSGIYFMNQAVIDDTNTIVANPGLYFVQQGSMHSSLSDVGIIGQAGAAATGIYARTVIHLSNVHVYSFSGKGIDISASADVTAAGSEYGNASTSTLTRCLSKLNGSHGFHIRGRDASVIKLDTCNADTNGGWGFLDDGLLGNLYINSHASANTLGTFKGSSAVADHVYTGCYTEAAARQNCDLTGRCVVVGGTLSETALVLNDNVGEATIFGPASSNFGRTSWTYPLDFMGPIAGTSTIFRHANEGMIFQGEGAARDLCFRNKADARVFSVPTGSLNVLFEGDISGEGMNLGNGEDGHEFNFSNANGYNIRLRHAPGTNDFYLANVKDGVGYAPLIVQVTGMYVNTTGGRTLDIEDAGLNLAAGRVYKINTQQVVGARGAAVADATDAASVITQLNALLARLRAHGLIAP